MFIMCNIDNHRTMKKSIIKISALWALFITSACSEDSIVENTININGNDYLQEISITGKDFQFENETRSSVSITENGASFTWDEDDVIGIFPNKGDQVSFAMDNGVGTQTATFSGGGWALKSSATYAAYYPHVYENRDMTKIPVSYVGQTQNGNNNTDHIGAYDFMAASVSTPSNGAVAFDMQHLGCLIQLNITIPEPSTLSKVVLNSSTKFTKAGTIDLTTETPSIVAKEQSNTLQIVLNNITTTKFNENVIIYFMTAPVDLTDCELTAVVHFTDEKTHETRIAGKNLQVGKAYRLTSELEGTIPNNQIWYTSSDGNIVSPYSKNAFGANIISNIYNNGKGIITFDKNVIMIGRQAFGWCTLLKNIIIPNSVTAIEHEAFISCFSLENITIPASVINIGYYILEDCKSLKNIIVAQGNSVYDSRDNCNAIIETSTNTLIQGCNETIIPKSVTTLRQNAFSLCLFTNITIPDGVTTIDNFAFTTCGFLENVVIPKSVTKISNRAFSDCTSLSHISVEKENLVYDSRDNCNAIIETSTNTLLIGCKNSFIPNSVISIGDFAFSSCESLTSITIPNSVTSIGDYAFDGCFSLARVDIKATTPPILSSNSFASCSKNLRIYVPAESIEDYKKTDYWKDLNLLPDSQ